MKPNAKMLGKATPLRGEVDLAADDDRRVKDAPGRAEPAFDARADSAEARLAIVNRVAAVSRALETMGAPPVLGVRTKDNENKPSQQRWDSARKAALERIHELHASLKKALAPNDGPNPAPSPPAPPPPHPVPHPPPVPVPAPPAPMPGPQVRGAGDRIDEDELNDELARLKESLDKHKPGKPEK